MSINAFFIAKTAGLGFRLESKRNLFSLVCSPGLSTIRPGSGAPPSTTRSPAPSRTARNRVCGRTIVTPDWHWSASARLDR